MWDCVGGGLWEQQEKLFILLGGIFSVVNCWVASKEPEMILIHVLRGTEFANKLTSAKFFWGFWHNLSFEYKAQSHFDIYTWH